MTTSDTFVQDFQNLLGKIPNTISFQQLQYDYRQVALLMGMKILNQFPQVLTGSPPLPGGGPIPAGDQPAGVPDLGEQPDGGPGLGPHPHLLCKLVCTLMDK